VTRPDNSSKRQAAAGLKAAKPAKAAKATKATKATKPARSGASSAPAGQAPRVGRPAGVRDGETERRILEAARRVFIRHGTAGARMQEIAAEAEVNPALLHYYFDSKDGLALAVFREAAGKLFPGVMRALASDAPIEARVETVVHRYIDMLRENPFLPGYVISELSFNPDRITALAAQLVSPDAPFAPRAALEHLGRELARRAAIGDFRPIGPDQFLVHLVSLCVFPFAARPMLRTVLALDDAEWNRFLDVRRRELPRFILNALRA